MAALAIRMLGQNQDLRQAVPPTLSAREVELLDRLDLGFTDAEWAHYRELVHERRAETITPARLDELRAMVTRLEAANVRRIAAVAELARLGGRGLEETMRDLGVGPVGRPYDE